MRENRTESAPPAEPAEAGTIKAAETVQTVRVSAGGGYDVRIGEGLLFEAGSAAKEVLKADRIAIFTDSAVDGLYADTVEKSCRRAGYETCRFVFAAGEGSKNMETVMEFVEFLSRHHLTRSDAVIALGGGVAGDMGGFAASIYLRGIDFIQIPTTLLAAVDSSVGGKTGINISAGKNLAGTFWQPSLVLYDTDTFRSLDDDLILDGTAEIIKTAAIRDEDLFRLVEKNSIGDILAQTVRRCVEIKGAVVGADEKEGGLRRILNFGHTMAHAIEKASDYRVSHGKAVACGMAMMTAASESAGMTEKGTCEILCRVLREKGFVLEHGFPLPQLCELAGSDKKTFGDRIHLVRIDRIGESSVFDMALDRLEDFMRSGVLRRASGEQREKR